MNVFANIKSRKVSIRLLQAAPAIASKKRKEKEKENKTYNSRQNLLIED